MGLEETVLTEAVRLAARAHAGQVDKMGRPYILHPLRLTVKASSTKAAVIAVLHDVVEDCGGYYGAAARDMAESVGELKALRAVTREKDEEYMAHIRRARDAGPVAREVKTLDVEDHIAEASTPELRKMVKTRYARALRVLRYRDC